MLSSEQTTSWGLSMEFSTRWIGAVGPGEDVQDGDLVICNVNSTGYLCLRASTDNEAFVIVLREFGEQSGDPIPRPVYASSLINGHPVRRFSGGELVIEPLTTAAEKAFEPKDTAVPSGALALLESGHLAIRVGSGIQALTLDIGTGAALKGQMPKTRLWETSWRLLWVFGDEAMELCRFPPGN
jgi:hypothetical protein